jgi:alanine dehydrogenase
VRVGVPKEIKIHEYRVGLTPESAARLVGHGHEVLVETGAGEGIGAGDADYRSAGATIARTAEEVFERAALVVKVKEPLAAERKLLRPGQCLFAYLHLAPDAEQARDLVGGRVTAIAYETVTSAAGGLPLLAPMSAVAGRMSVQVAAHYLERPSGGRGILLSGAWGVEAARLLVLGAGVVGSNAVKVAVGMGARVTVLDRALEALHRLRVEFGSRLQTMASSPENVIRQLARADAVIGAALVPGALAPRLVTRGMLAGMKPRAVMIDVAVDQGGCFETSRPTTHADPVYTVDGILHYCVPNMPGAVPRTSAYALNYATLPFVMELADRGIGAALRANAHLRNGLTVCAGAVTRREVADALGNRWTDPLDALDALPEPVAA